MKSGFVAILGRPNVGKSTLLNILLDYDLSIISEKPQTTRNSIRGIYNDSDSQIIFVDTPGFHKPKQLFGEVLNEKVDLAYKNSDLVMFLTPSNQPIGPGDQMIIDKLKSIKNKVAVITKCDIEMGKEILDEKAQYLLKNNFKSVISASDKDPNCQKKIVSFIKEFMEEGELLYPVDEITDKPIRFIVKEIIRESAINNLHHELPHHIAIQVDKYQKENKTRIIEAVIFVEKDSQKGILIGENASMIKTIGKTSRLKIQRLIDEKVHLQLYVKVLKNWTKNPSKIKELGY